jgi:hypothetical protein
MRVTFITDLFYVEYSKFNKSQIKTQQCFSLKSFDFNVNKIGKVCFVQYTEVPEVLFVSFLMGVISYSLNGY